MSELVGKINNAQRIWIAGNGGSASTAEHFATDLVKLGLRAVALSSCTSLITMIANDYGYDKIYSRQLEVFGEPEDLLVTLSCSGTSPNIVEAHKTADEIGMDRYAFETFIEGGKHPGADYRDLEDQHLQQVHEVIDVLEDQ